MTYKKGKQQFTKEEIIEILRRNVNLFKDEDEFVDYIVELALYLVEHRMQTQTEANDGTMPSSTKESEEVFEKRREPFQRGGFWGTDAEIHGVLERHVRESQTELIMCRVCGAMVPRDRKTCPICASIM